MSYNVPDDWGSYYYACGCHASGGCDCPETQLADSERPWLQASDYKLEDGSWSRMIIRKQHTCRRDHADGKVKVGQKYVRTTYRMIDDESGESHMYHRKRILR